MITRRGLLKLFGVDVLGLVATAAYPLIPVRIGDWPKIVLLELGTV